MNLKTGLFFLMILFSGAFSYQYNVHQYLDVNASTLYINDFMLCYLSNNSLTYWDNYISGNASIVLPNSTLNYIYELYCCDNCEFIGTNLFLGDGALDYYIGSSNISGNMIKHYYVADVIIDSRTVDDIGISDRNLSIFSGLTAIHHITIALAMIFCFGVCFTIIFGGNDGGLTSFFVGGALGFVLALFYLIAVEVFSIFLVIMFVVIGLGVFALWGAIGRKRT